MYQVFRVDDEIEVLRAKQGDLLICDLADSTGTVSIVREHGPEYLAVVARHRKDLTPLSPGANLLGEPEPDDDAGSRGRGNLHLLK